MMDMYGELPESVSIGGIPYEIDTSFKTGIKVESILLDTKKEDYQKVIDVIELYFPIKPPIEHIEETIRAIIWFYTGKEFVPGKKANHGSAKRHFSFDVDAPLVFAAFFQQYGIDLSKDNIHWWKFRAMFSALSDDTTLMKVVHYRATPITQKMPKETADFYRKMKSLYALPEDKDDERKLAFVTDALMRGESLDGITERYYAKYGSE